MAQNSAIIATPPQISVAARGEIKVNPDHATLQISVQTKAATAAAAANENAAKQKAVIDALKALGLHDSDISTSDYSVYPEQRYEPNKEPVVVGYNVTNTLSVEVTSLKMVGPVIDASLAKGANMITSLQFSASNTEAARRSAIAMAITRAHGDAEAAAKAAGGSLGGLLEVTIGAYYAPPPRPFDMKARSGMAVATEQTPVNPGEQTVSVDLTTRWVYLGPMR
ncbi:MAG TPA: SIMPL domain-containing protein [Gemmatimonadaceae bacterium]|nr:SIMPL domain-containing protein [Gemmatimonadaceae bacterium]